MKEQTYFEGLFSGVKTLAIGLKTTMRELFTKKITQQYPENRKTLVMFDKFKGCLTMPHDENNEHKCVGCGICEANCPNNTIIVKTKMIETEDGKKKKVLDEHIYDQGICMFCMICVRVCPHDAITFNQDFETAVFDRKKLVLKLNKEGSKCKERKPAPRPIPKTTVSAPSASNTVKLDNTAGSSESNQ